MNGPDIDECAARRIFLEAVRIDSPAQREAYLTDACRADTRLCEAVTELLDVFESTGRVPSEVRGTSDSGDPGGLGPAAPAGGAGKRFVPGQVLARRYRIVSMLGQGGMGEVYRADDLRLGHPVALKLVPERLAEEAGFLDALYNEVRHARRVAHRHVTRVFDVGEADGLHFLIMEFIEGEHLGSLLRRIGRLPLDKALELARQLGEGLREVHGEGLLHLDLKPQNLMIDERGDLKITDFGLAQVMSEDGAATTRSGTAAYMAPEQLLRGEVSPRSDLHAFGLILHEMVTGRRLCDVRSMSEALEWHRAAAPPACAPECPPALRAIIASCVAREPDERPPSVDEVLKQLERVGPETPPDALATESPPYPAVLYTQGDRRIDLLDRPEEVGAAVAVVKRGARVTVEEHFADEEGRVWLRVSFDPGWMAAIDLRQPARRMIAGVDSDVGSGASAANVAYPGSDGLNLRVSPDYPSDVIAKVLQGSLLRVVGDEIRTETHVWWQVELHSGWVLASKDGDRRVKVVGPRG